VRPSPAQRRRTDSSIPRAPVASSSTTRHEPIMVYDSDEEVERGLARMYHTISDTAIVRFSHSLKPSANQVSVVRGLS
jgi:hypothetical protein